MKKSNKPTFSAINVVFFGTDDFSLPCLQALLDSGWRVSAVITKPDTRAGRGRQLKTSGVKTVAENRGIKKIFQPETLAEIEQEITALKPDFGVLVAYGQLIPARFIDLFPGGIINVHPSLLPCYRGPSPIEAAILNGDKQTGISLMKLAVGMDTGPVYAQMIVDLAGNEDRFGLTKDLAEKGARFLVEKLPAIVDGSIKPTLQNDSQATYSTLLKKEDGRVVDWNKPAAVIEKMVRAYQGYPKTTAEVAGREVVIIKSRVANNQDDGQLVIKCAPGWLEILELVAPSGRTITGADYLHGYT